MESFADPRVGDPTHSKPQRQGRVAENAFLNIDEIKAREYAMSNKATNPRIVKLKCPNGDATDKVLFSIEMDEVTMKKRKIMEPSNDDGTDNIYKNDKIITLSSGYPLCISSLNGYTFSLPAHFQNEADFFAAPIEEQKYWARRGLQFAGIADTPNERDGLHEEQGLPYFAQSIGGIKMPINTGDEIIESGIMVLVDVQRIDGGYKRPFRLPGVDHRKIVFALRPYDPRKVVSWDTIKYYLQYLFYCNKDDEGRNRAAPLALPPHHKNWTKPVPTILRQREPSGANTTIGVHPPGLAAGQPLTGCNILYSGLKKEERVFMLMKALPNGSNKYCTMESAGRVIECLIAAERTGYYCAAAFIGQWLKTKLLRGVSDLMITAGVNTASQQFVLEADFQNELQSVAEIFSAPYLVKQFQTEVELYFLARQEVNERIIGRALRTASPGQRFDMLIGKGYCT